jgi:hypothetical protein
MPFPLDEKYVCEAEERLGVHFPPAYRARMMKSIGGEVAAIGDHWELYPIYDKSSRKRIKRTRDDIVRETGGANQWAGFPAGAVAIGHNGSGDLLLFPPRADDPSLLDPAVWFWDHETGQIRKVADRIIDLPPVG